MNLKIVTIVLTLSVFGNGKPLETSEDMSQFFSSRIVGGVDAEDGYAPHMVALVVGHDYRVLVCGGSIVSSKLILTAAHCVEMFVVWGQLLPTFHGIVGSNYWDTPSNAVQFENFHIHPQWDWSTLKNDIAVLSMTEDLVWSTTVGPVALSFERVEGEEPAYVTGWGQLAPWPSPPITPPRLQKLNVKTMSHEDCVNALEEFAKSFNETTLPEIAAEIEICTFHSFGHGMCNGDSGSALVSRITNEQIGIVSWGIPCARGAPDIFVRISGYKPFFERILASY